MRKLLVVALMNLIATATCLAKDAIGDWEAVQQDIPSGWQVTVETSFAFPCIFEKASSDELVCHLLGPGQVWQNRDEKGEIRVRRDRIHEIRVERREGANMLAGGLVGTGVGAGFGSILAAVASRGASAYMFGVIGGTMGARASRRVHILHGKVIYRRPVLKEAADLPLNPHLTEH